MEDVEVFTVLAAIAGKVSEVIQSFERCPHHHQEEDVRVCAACTRIQLLLGVLHIHLDNIYDDEMNDDDVWNKAKHIRDLLQELCTVSSSLRITCQTMQKPWWFGQCSHSPHSS